MTNQERALRGAQTVNAYMDREPAYSPGEAAIDAVTDVLHAYCGDPEAAEILLDTAKSHYFRETEEEEEDCRCTVTRDEDGREEREIDAGCPLHGED